LYLESCSSGQSLTVDVAKLRIQDRFKDRCNVQYGSPGTFDVISAIRRKSIALLSPN